MVLCLIIQIFEIGKLTRGKVKNWWTGEAIIYIDSVLLEPKNSNCQLFFRCEWLVLRGQTQIISDALAYGFLIGEHVRVVRTTIGVRQLAPKHFSFFGCNF